MGTAAVRRLRSSRQANARHGEGRAALAPTMKQYEIRWARLPEPVGHRPVLLLTRSTAYSYLTKILAAEVTTRVRGIAQEVPLGPRDGLPKRCAAKLDNVHLIPARAIGDLIAALHPERIPEVKRAMGHVLFWPELMGLLA
jgi:mRNA interferase MazF